MNPEEINWLESGVEFKEVKNYSFLYITIFVIILVSLITFILYSKYQNQQSIAKQECEDRGLNYSKTIYKEKEFIIECFDLRNTMQIKKLNDDWERVS